MKLFEFLNRERKKKKEVERTLLQLTQIIDCSKETFEHYLTQCTKGYLLGLHNLLVITFNRTQEAKNNLVNQIELGNVPKEDNTLEGIYNELFKIEHKVFILRHYLKEKHGIDLT